MVKRRIGLDLVTFFASLFLDGRKKEALRVGRLTIPNT
jgi:hypothetical protein